MLRFRMGHFPFNAKTVGARGATGALHFGLSIGAEVVRTQSCSKSTLRRQSRCSDRIAYSSGAPAGMPPALKKQPTSNLASGRRGSTRRASFTRLCHRTRPCDEAATQES